MLNNSLIFSLFILFVFHWFPILKKNQVKSIIFSWIELKFQLIAKKSNPTLCATPKTLKTNYLIPLFHATMQHTSLYFTPDAT